VLDGTPTRIESIASYSLSSDNGQGDFAPWTLGLGAHTVTATPYTATNAGGQAGEALTVTFTLGRGAAPVPDGGIAPPPSTGGAMGAGGFVTDAGVVGAGGTGAAPRKLASETPVRAMLRAPYGADADRAL